MFFVVGTKFYIRKKPNKEAATLYLKVFTSIAVSDNLYKVACCLCNLFLQAVTSYLALPFLRLPLSIQTAVYRWIKLGKIEGKKHLLQYASPKFSVGNHFF